MEASGADSQDKRSADLSELIPEHEWSLYVPVLEAARARKIRYALGGGLAFSAYSARLRNTKDVDLFILPSDREAMIEIVGKAGFSDYYEQEAYDRSWIYRGYRDEIILDLIWRMANHRTEVDPIWLNGGSEVHVRGCCLKLLPVEELLWSKLYVLQHDRCDWPDMLNILYAQSRHLDWQHLFNRLGSDAAVMGGVMCLFRWICPAPASELPGWIWERMGLNAAMPDPDYDIDRRRVELLDTRNWFGPNV